MIAFDDLVARAAARKGGRDALEAMIEGPRSKEAIVAIKADRWLAEITRVVFRAGFTWSVIDKKWDGFERAFEGFDPHRWSLMNDDDLDRLVADNGIVRHAKKILSVRDNAHFLLGVEKEAGSVGAFFANSPKNAYVDLLERLKKDAARLGGASGQYMLRHMGVDSVIFTDHVARALIREGVVDKKPSAKKDLRACQDAFDRWLDEGAGSLTRISRVLALGVDD